MVSCNPLKKNIRIGSTRFFSPHFKLGRKIKIWTLPLINIVEKSNWDIWDNFDLDNGKT